MFFESGDRLKTSENCRLGEGVAGVTGEAAEDQVVVELGGEADSVGELVPVLQPALSGEPGVRSIRLE